MAKKSSQIEIKLPTTGLACDNKDGRQGYSENDFCNPARCWIDLDISKVTEEKRKPIQLEKQRKEKCFKSSF